MLKSNNKKFQQTVLIDRSFMVKMSSTSTPKKKKQQLLFATPPVKGIRAEDPETPFTLTREAEQKLFDHPWVQKNIVVPARVGGLGGQELTDFGRRMVASKPKAFLSSDVPPIPGDIDERKLRRFISRFKNRISEIDTPRTKKGKQTYTNRLQKEMTMKRYTKEAAALSEGLAAIQNNCEPEDMEEESKFMLEGWYGFR